MFDTDKLDSIRAALDRREEPYIVALRAICERIGYGRVAQLANDWMEQLHPGHGAASDAVAAGRHRKRLRET